MAEKLLKAGKRKITAKKCAANDRTASTKPPQEIALVGTYREKQFDWIRKNGVYNYPVKDGDEFDATAFGKIRELWLYAGSKGKRHCFAAEFVGKMTRDEFLAAYPTYAKIGRAASTKPPKDNADGRGRSPSAPHAAYYVFKASFLDYGPKLDNPQVVIRAMDFATGRGRTKSVKKAFDQFKQDGEFAPLSAYLPSELNAVPRQQLRVCDGGACLSAWSPVKGMTPQLEKIESIVMSIAMFAKAQNVSAAQAYKVLTRNRVIEHLDEHYEIESCLPIEHIVSDMEGMCGICGESAR